MIHAYIVSTDAVHPLSKRLLNIFKASEMRGKDSRRERKLLVLSPGAIPGGHVLSPENRQLIMPLSASYQNAKAHLRQAGDRKAPRDLSES